MSMAKRWLETLPEFDEVAEPEFVTLTVWCILSDADIDALLGCDVADFEDDNDEPAIEDDYDWIRGGC